MGLAFDFVNIFYDHHLDRDNFTAELLKLIAKADPFKMEQLERGFPLEARLYKAWYNSPEPPPREEIPALIEKVQKEIETRNDKHVRFKEYIGDSVYVGVENGMIRLTTENGFGASNVIYLDDSVYESLLLYRESLLKKLSERQAQGGADEGV